MGLYFNDDAPHVNSGMVILVTLKLLPGEYAAPSFPAYVERKLSWTLLTTPTLSTESVGNRRFSKGEIPGGLLFP